VADAPRSQDSGKCLEPRRRIAPHDGAFLHPAVVTFYSAAAVRDAHNGIPVFSQEMVRSVREGERLLMTVELDTYLFPLVAKGACPAGTFELNFGTTDQDARMLSDKI